MVMEDHSETNFDVSDKELEYGQTKDGSQSKKNKLPESVNVMIQQAEAVRECREAALRKFIRMPVEIDTIGGKPLVYDMWVSDEKPHPVKPPSYIIQTFTCSICNKEFDENRKLLLHVRYHKDHIK